MANFFIWKENVCKCYQKLQIYNIVSISTNSVGITLGKTTIIKSLIYHMKKRKPENPSKYKSIWDLQLVLDLKQLPENEELSEELLRTKCCILIRFLLLARKSDCFKFHLNQLNLKKTKLILFSNIQKLLIIFQSMHLPFR